MDVFTFGELIVLELMLAEKIKDTDLSMQSGQFMISILGKLEYQLSQLKGAADQQLALEPTETGSPRVSA